MAFYHFRQNNSGGWFAVDDSVTVNVIIEANNADTANVIAESIGIYFDGCREGYDCRCCGNRWSRARDSDGEIEPVIYGVSIPEYAKESYAVSSVEVGKPYAHVYYANGEKVTYIREY